MSENNTVIAKQQSQQPLLTVVEGKVKTTSLDVAEKFGKQHKDVIRSVRQIGCSELFAQRNFAPSSYQDANKKSQPMYEITRDGFCFLVMGFTGKDAAKWKESYISAFNQMETELHKLDRPKVDEGERRRLRDQKAKLVRLVTQSKTVFERSQYLADMKEVCAALGQSLPNETEIGVPVPVADKLTEH